MNSIMPESLFQVQKAGYYVRERCSSSDSTDLVHSDEEALGVFSPDRLSPEHHAAGTGGIAFNMLELQESLAAKPKPGLTMPPAPTLRPAADPHYELPPLELPEAYALQALAELQGTFWRLIPLRSLKEEAPEQADHAMEEGIFLMETETFGMSSSFVDASDEEEEDACTGPVLSNLLNSTWDKV
eukprot:TRINITY_DN102386_c0_g1_i1.p1 TRINITY_DN102386_c0_g1~~TRINITY_DN102386_c0_g1_i1.p1  ORF type:complete len:185 (-),score=46.08 TRINITY_DN102386_c0_g1_i1:15-569(-)